MPIGAYKPEWFMEYIHISPTQSVQAHIDLNPKVSLAMHWGTFQLSDESYDAPINETKAILKRDKISNFKIIDLGETLDFQEYLNRSSIQ